MIGLSQLQIAGDASIEPGGTGRAIVLTSPEVRNILIENLAIGDSLQLCEGLRIVGEAQVVKLLD